MLPVHVVRTCIDINCECEAHTLVALAVQAGIHTHLQQSHCRDTWDGLFAQKAPGWSAHTCMCMVHGGGQKGSQRKRAVHHWMMAYGGSSALVLQRLACCCSFEVAHLAGTASRDCTALRLRVPRTSR